MASKRCRVCGVNVAPEMLCGLCVKSMNAAFDRVGTYNWGSLEAAAWAAKRARWFALRFPKLVTKGSR